MTVPDRTTGLERTWAPEGVTAAQAATSSAAAARSSEQEPRAHARIHPDQVAIAAGLLCPLALAAILVPFRTSFANTDAALAMILLIVAIAAAGNRIAGYVAALSAAAWFDFFLTRPYETFTINRATDIETTTLLLVIGIAVTEIAVWGRRQHAAASRRAGYLEGINDAARAVATGDSPSNLIDQIADSLVQLLSLRSCQFQYGVAGLGRPARLQHDGHVVLNGLPIDLRVVDLPVGTSIELLVESGGRLQGRFLMQPAPGAHPTREQLLVAAALADQAGAALAASYPLAR
jgi:K+-sensing histidine kinase KdpD